MQLFAFWYSLKRRTLAGHGTWNALASRLETCVVNILSAQGDMTSHTYTKQSYPISLGQTVRKALKWVM